MFCIIKINVFLCIVKILYFSRLVIMSLPFSELISL